MVTLRVKFITVKAIGAKTKAKEHRYSLCLQKPCLHEHESKC